MGADSVLVRASLGADVSAAGAAVPNMKPLYDSNLSNMKTAFGVINTAMDMYGKKKDALKLGRDNQLKGFKKVSEQNYARLFTQKEPMPQKVINAVDKRIRELQDEFEAVNTYGKNDNVENERARTRLTASLKRIVNQAVTARATFMKLGDNTKHWNDGAIKDGVIAPQMKMMDTKNMDKDDDVFVGFDDNNDMIFSAQNYYTEISGGSGVSTGGAFTREEKKSGNLVSFSLSQMEENIPGADLDLDAHVIETMNAFGSTQAQSDASMGPDQSYDQIGFADEIGRRIQTPEDFRNLALRKVLDTEPSLKSALQSDFGIANELLNVMFDEETLNQMDTDNSGDISIADMKGLEGEDLKMFEDNFDIMVSTLTDVDNRNFNLKRSKDLLISYFDKTTNERYNNTFDTKYKALNKKADSDQGDDGSGNYPLGINGELFNVATGQPEWKGYKYNKQGNMLYDDEASLAAIKKHETFIDAFQNIYKPKSITQKPPHSDIKGYNAVDGMSGKLITDEEGKPVFISIDEAMRNAYGKSTIKSASQF
jgi:hypothetical protein